MKHFITTTQERQTPPVHEECQPAAVTRDATFDITAHPGVLLNIAIRIHASLQVQSTLSNALTKGQEMMESFKEQCMSEGQDKWFHAPISISKIVTFVDYVSSALFHYPMMMDQ